MKTPAKVIISELAWQENDSQHVPEFGRSRDGVVPMNVTYNF